MSLTPDERAATINELSQNFDLAGVSLSQAADELHTTTDHLRQVLNLQVTRIEEPWILRNYLVSIILDQGKEPYPFSKLNGDPSRYPFLDDQFIQRGKLA